MQNLSSELAAADRINVDRPGFHSFLLPDYYDLIPAFERHEGSVSE